MITLTEILRIVVDGVRKAQIASVTLIFYKKNNINTVWSHDSKRTIIVYSCLQIYDSYSIVLDYSMKLPDDESNTSIQMIAHILHQIEYMFNWNDAFPATMLN